MILKIADKINNYNIGNKAKNLQILKNNDFNIPDGIIISNETLKNLDNYIEEIISKLDMKKSYAVRSSSSKEDMDNLSFAGLYNTYLNIKGRENIIESIKKCYESRLSSENIEYCKNNNIDMEDIEMAVIVQEMVDADISGIGFTINSITGNDKEIVIEVIEGLGEKNVSGKAKPEKYVYNWYEEHLQENNNTLLSKDILKNLNEQLLNIQMLFGYPVDVEFAIKNNIIYFLQVRPITKIMFSEIDKQWTTANFRDGGVSSRLCLPLMASIYSNAFAENEKNTFLKMKLFKKEELKDEVVKYFYGRLYWDISICKDALMKTPGFIERVYETELGIPILYEGDGLTTKINFKFLKELPGIILGFQKTVNDQMENIEEFNKKQLKKYEKFNNEKLENKTLGEMEKIWKDYIENEFFINEETYLLQVYINTIKQTSFKKEFLEIMEYGDYLNLLSGIQNLSHTRPLKKESEIINRIYTDKNILEYWKNSSEEKILADYISNKNQKYFEGINEYIKEYGYHSNSDLDLTVEPYYYDTKSVITRFKNNIITDNLSILLKSDFEKNDLYNKVINNLKEKLPNGKFKKVEKKIIEMQTFMWWREELKDLSNRYYALVKKYTKILAEKYYEKGVLKDKMDIHYLKYTDILEYIDKKIDKEKIYNIIDKNKKYCKSFINFKNPNDIGKRYGNINKQATVKKNILKGVGCSSGIKSGKVRVVKSLEDINKIQKGEILVTKFIDTGWISRFGILNGVVSEYGGTLCHSSIVAREYEIPAIVGIEDVEKMFKDGEIIEIDGYTGEIRKI